MDFSELLLERIVYEARYDKGFLYWDNCGRLVSAMARDFPSLELQNVSLTNAACALWDESLTFNFDYTKLVVSQAYPKKLDLFSNLSDQLNQKVQKHLEVKTFTRVGVRYFYVLPTETKEKAREIVAGVTLISVDPAKISPFGQQIVEREVMIRVEDEDRGYTVRVSQPTREVKLKVERPLSISVDEFYPNVVMVDVDTYSKQLVDASSFAVAEFVRAASRTLRENLVGFVGL